MIQILIVAAVIVSLVLGFKGFTKQGLPLTKDKNLTGTPAKIVGACCLLFGMCGIAAVVWFFMRIASGR